MSKTVFILGAGASLHANAPLMNTFLDVAEGLMVRREVDESADDFKRVFDALASLSHAHSKATLDVINIESVFAAFEMAQLLGRIGTIEVPNIHLLSDSMGRVIVRTLEKSVKFPIANSGSVGATPAYMNLISLIRDRIQAKNKWDASPALFSFITFNYDLCLDVAIAAHQTNSNYFLQGVKPPSINLLKLHGSLNWAKCTGCNKLVAWPMSNFIEGRSWTGAASGWVEVSKHMHEFQHCRGGDFLHQFVVPPTWNKSQYHLQLDQVWKAAAMELSTAENIFVCGYSLPESDHFFRHLYALGTVGELRLKRLWVFDPDPSVEVRFRGLLGQAVTPRFQFFPKPFEEMQKVVETVI